jgi:hypothetical protein
MLRSDPQEPVPPATHQPQIPALLDQTIRGCLARAPDERFVHAVDLNQ